MRATIACATWKGSCALCKSPKIWKSIFALPPRKQKSGFFLILLILAVSAVLSQLTPLAIGYLTDHVLAGQNASFASVAPILVAILVVNIVNELIKVARRLIVEDTAAQAEKTARQRAALSLLIAPLSYFRAHMTGNIHGRLNRSLEGTVKLIKLMGLRPRRDHRSGGGGHDLHAAARLRGVAGGAGDSRGYLHRAQADRYAEGHPRGADGYQGGHGRRHGGAAGRYRSDPRPGQRADGRRAHRGAFRAAAQKGDAPSPGHGLL